MKELINLNWDDESRDRQNRFLVLLAVFGIILLALIIFG
jgi:hypothetical protein